jgi:glyoxylase-like metal-dependent hydrolase (beta-lactamase superfamily II)
VAGGLGAAEILDTLAGHSTTDLPQNVVFFIREHATLVCGDVLSGTGGRLHVFVDEADPKRLLPALDRLGDLPIERVIIPHGDAILSHGAARIRIAVAEAQRGAPEQQ